MIQWIKAFVYAANKHKGQYDKGGKPYIFHPLHVSLRCNSYEARIAGMLHDVIEDTEVSSEDLIVAGFPKAIVDAVQILSKSENENYFEYVRRIKNNPIAAEVKRNDLKHNMNLERLSSVSTKDCQRVQKYAKALMLLQ